MPSYTVSLSDERESSASCLQSECQWSHQSLPLPGDQLRAPWLCEHFAWTACTTFEQYHTRSTLNDFQWCWCSFPWQKCLLDASIQCRISRLPTLGSIQWYNSHARSRPSHHPSKTLSLWLAPEFVWLFRLVRKFFQGFRYVGSRPCHWIVLLVRINSHCRGRLMWLRGLAWL